MNVEYSRWAVKMLQRWGYDVRYHELPGRGHEDMKVQPGIWEWLLQHRRQSHPRSVRVRAADLRSAHAYWVRLTSAERPMEFLVAEAEVIGPNRIRLDTRNVVAAELLPGPLVDASKPVEVVWNGAARSLTARDGRLELRAEGHPPAALEKTDRLAGPFEDAAGTPFAVVLGTIARDPEMRRACEWKVKAFVAAWRDWQKVEPRVFKDTEISDADAARYSLLLVGGPGENAVAKRLAGKVPLEVRPDAFVVDGKAFPAADAGVSFVYPSPLNPERYVAVLAGTSPGGLWFADWQNGEWDFQIVDGRSAAAALSTRPASSLSGDASRPAASTAPGASTSPSSCGATRFSGRRRRPRSRRSRSLSPRRRSTASPARTRSPAARGSGSTGREPASWQHRRVRAAASSSRSRRRSSS